MKIKSDENRDVMRRTRPPLASVATPRELGEALAVLKDIDDPAKRSRVFMDRLTRLMAGTVVDREERQKIQEARFEMLRRTR